MKKSQKKLLAVLSSIFCLSGIGAMVLALVPVSILVGLPVLLSGILAAVMANSARIEEVNAKVDNLANKTSTEANIPNNLKKVLDSCLEMSLILRTAGLPPDVITASELIIDKIVLLAPKLQKDHPGSEMTFVVSKLGTEYLNDLITPFASMSSDTQKAKSGELTDTLTKLLDELKKMETAYEARSVSDFDVQARFMRVKFFGETISAA